MRVPVLEVKMDGVDRRFQKEMSQPPTVLPLRPLWYRKLGDGD